MRRQRERDTGPELALRRALHHAGLRYRVHRRPIRTLRRQADILFGPSRVAVFVHGCFWHGCPEHATWPATNAEFWLAKIETNRRRDVETLEALGAAGWMGVVVWEHEDPGCAAERVAQIVLARRAQRLGGRMRPGQAGDASLAPS